LFRSGSEPLAAAPPFDLVVIDEAHEIFAGLHKRYDRDGAYDEASEEALMAHRVRGFLRTSPVLLLTATPMQNSLAELWGLVQYVEPTGTLLGDITTFRQVFCADDDRILVPGQEHELQRRLAPVLQRTLRRQAQEFLDRPFTERRCRLYEYEMSSDERSLYDDVTEYLMQPSLYAFTGSQRRLLLIGFHRRMASSIPALAASLENVAGRLRQMAAGRQMAKAADDLTDLEDDDGVDEANQKPAEPDTPGIAVDRKAVESELALVETFVKRAKSLPHDAKARSFQDAIRVVLDLGRRGEGSGKAVVFTESITTQEYIRKLLLDMGLNDEDVTLFRGTNDHDRAKQAHARWLEEEARHLPPGTRPSREVAIRLALVHEFRTRSKVLVCTEAGAKGLNLQFCETVINYDLPWNPQRIEQRIGRCHRYSQQRDVTVVNFIAKDNEAHRLTFEILSQKLDLFGKVLDASDHVLHEPKTDAPELVASAVSLEFETDLRDIYSRSRSLAEVTREIATLRDKIGGRREAYEREYRRTSQIIESRFDDDVRKVFRHLRDELPAGLLQLDRDIADLVEGYLESHDVGFVRSEADGRILFDVENSVPAAVGEVVNDERRFATGDARGLEQAQPLNLLHPLVQRAVHEARQWDGGSIELTLPPDTSPELRTLAGRTGALAVALVDYAGFEPVQRLVAAAAIDGAPIDPSIAGQLLRLKAGPADGVTGPAEGGHNIDDAVDEAVFLDQRDVEELEQKHFERAISQLERFVDDKVLVSRRERTSLAQKLRAAKQRRDEVVGSTARDRVEAEILRLSERDEALEQRIQALNSREDEVYRKWRNAYHDLRYRAPQVTRLFTVTFRIAPARETSC
ncbi:MAG: helicase-related protein, partial [Vicinamibacterales bacterium]